MRSAQSEHVTCGWCGTNFDLDPTLAAHLYECPSCGERQVLGALRHSNLDPNAIEISHSLSFAAANNLHRFTLGYSFGEDGREELGSGTLIQIGGRCLIATTAHTIPFSTNQIRIAPKLEQHEFVRHPSVLKLAKSNTVDVGLIEVEVDAPRLLGMESLQIDRVADLRYGREAARCWLIGFPVAQVQPDHATQELRFEANSFSCEPIAPTAWGGVPLANKDSSHDPNLHVLTHYSLGEPLFVHSENPSRDEYAPEPFGLSGGGFWQCSESREGRVWSPSMLCLFAIQSSWCKGREHLKAVQIIHWLRLVAETLPDLRDELCDRFPRLLRLLQLGE